MLSKRLSNIKERMFGQDMVKKKQWWGKNTTIVDRPGILKEPLIIRKAKAIEYVCRNLPADIKSDELIVGMPNMAAVGFGYVFPEYATPQEKEQAAKKCLNEYSVWGHHPVRYDKLLSLGLKGFRAEIVQKMDQELSRQHPRQQKLELYRSMLISLDAVRDFASRYSQLAFKLALSAKDTQRRRELLEIADICAKVPENPAASFHEALQSFWLTYAVFHSCMEYLPAGRADQFLYPYYRYDLDNGVITPAKAADLVGSWLAKFNERVQIKKELWEDHYTYGNFSQGGDPVDSSTHIVLDNAESYNYGLSANHWLMNMIVGGQDADGNDSTNELTYLILSMWSELELVAPVMSVRLHPNSPQRLYQEVSAILAKGGTGEPALYNDQIIIEGLTAMGVPLREARDYSNDGCWEVLVPGKTEFTYFHVEVLLLVEYVLNRGKSILRDTQEGLDTGDATEFEDFETFYGAFAAQMRKSIEGGIQNKVKYYGEVSKIAPDPLISSMMDDCVQNGLDITQGGARYRMHSPLITGLSHCADSLAVIKKLVYEEKKLSMAQLIEALKTNFKDQETLRQMFINRAPKYGNDHPYVDCIAQRILDDFDRIVEDCRKKYKKAGFLFNPGIGTFESYARFGNVVGASADGRLATETLASNYSPSVGMDMAGPTATIKSATLADLSRYMTGCPIDLSINANEVAGEAGREKLASFIKSFIELGGQILTITVSSEEVYRDAQINPEKHKGLRVRLGGLSAYFIALPPKHQEIMIERLH